MRAGKTTPTDTVETENNVSTTVTPYSSEFTKDELTNIHSWEDALRLAENEFGKVDKVEETELGDGFRVATEVDKRRLIGVPLLFLDWHWVEGDYADEYVSAHVIAPNEQGVAFKWILNDGGTGVREQLRDYQTKYGRMGGLMARNGLRVSDYATDPDTNKPVTKKQIGELLAAGKKTGRGATFYVDTSA